MNVLITGGAGFIGSNFLNLFVPRYPEHKFINLDKLTYAANILNLKDTENMPNYIFEKGDIANYNQVVEIFDKYNPDVVVHFAAESHVDRSIIGPTEFIQTNIIGTFNLLEVCRKNWPDSQKKNKLFHHVGTDEVYISLSLNETDLFTENIPYIPHTPYSDSKASSDHLVKAYYYTYNIPVKIANCLNDYSPYQLQKKELKKCLLK